MAEEIKRDVFMNRIQVVITILGGIMALIVGISNVTNSVFANKAPGSLTVSVLSDKGRTVPAHIELYDSQNTVTASSQIPSSGAYSVKDLAAGSYMIKVTSGGHEPQAATIKIDAKKTTHIDMILRSLNNPKTTGSPIVSAFEDVGASWIKKLGRASR
jgi:hypothetical protein